MRTQLGLFRRERFFAYIVGLSLIISLSLTAGLVGPAQGQDNEAETDQRIVSLNATYDIDAEAGKVDVVESITVANVKGSTRGSTTITRYFWTGQTVWVPTDADNLSITSNGDDLEYTVEESVAEVGIDILSVDYPTNLNYGQTRVVDVAYSLSSDLPDDSNINRRVNAASIDLSILVCCNFENVELLVTAPASFDLLPPRNLDFSESTSEAGRQRFEFSESEEGGQFTELIIMDWVGADDNGLDRTKVEAYPMIEVVSPPDDTQWNQDTSTFISDVVSELESLTGQDSPIQGASFQQSGGANFDKWGQSGSLAKVELPRNFSENGVAVTLARQWVASGPFTNDDINTGLAIDLGAEALRASGGRPENPGNPPTSPSIGDAQAFWIMRQISDEIGHEALGATLEMAINNETAYVGSVEPETVATIENDWRRFLDLVEHRGGAEGAPELFEEYLLDDEAISELQTRNESVAAYDEIESRAGSVPLAIRTAMTNWDFSEADTLMVEASSILDERDLVVAKAEEKGEDSSVPLGSEWENAQSADDLEAARGNIADRDAELSGGLLRTLFLVVLGLLALAGLAIAGTFFGKKLTGRKSVETIPSSAVNSPSQAPSPPTPPVPATPLPNGNSSASPPSPPMAPTGQPAAPISQPTAPPVPPVSAPVGTPPVPPVSAPVVTPPVPPVSAPVVAAADAPPMPPAPLGSATPPMPPGLNASSSTSDDVKVTPPPLPATPPVPSDAISTNGVPGTPSPSTDSTQIAPTEAVTETVLQSPKSDPVKTDAGDATDATDDGETTSLPVTTGVDASSDDDVTSDEVKKPAVPDMPPGPPTKSASGAVTQPPTPSSNTLTPEDQTSGSPDSAITQVLRAEDTEIQQSPPSKQA